MTRLIKWVAGGMGALTTAIVVALIVPGISGASSAGYCMISSVSTLRGHAGDTIKVFATLKGADFTVIELNGDEIDTTSNRSRAVGTVPDWKPGDYDLSIYCSDVDGGSTYSRQFTILPS